MGQSGSAVGGLPKDGSNGRGRDDTAEDLGTGQHYAVTEEDPLIPSRAPRRSSTRAPTRPSLNSIGEEEEGLEEPAYKQKSYLKSPYWWAGIILMTTGEAGNFLAYGFAPASIVSPLGVVALISNCIIAPLMLKEPYRKRDGLGVLIAVGGAVTVVLSANDNNPKLGPDEIWDLISTWEFETYLGITIGVIVALMVASNRFGEKNILIDLGLVGLFGMFVCQTRIVCVANSSRWLYRSLHQGSGLDAILYTLARHHISRHLPACRYLGRHSYHADQVYQPRASAFRRNTGHPRSICHVYALCYSRFGYFV